MLLDQRDLPTRPVTVVTGPQEVAQNIREAISIPYGSLPWDREAGSHLFAMKNARTDRAAIVAEIKRVMQDMRGLIRSSVAVRWDPVARRYDARFMPREADREVTFGGELAPVPPDPTPTPPTRDYPLMQIAPGEFLLVAPGSRLRV